MPLILSHTFLWVVHSFSCHMTLTREFNFPHKYILHFFFDILLYFFLFQANDASEGHRSSWTPLLNSLVGEGQTVQVWRAWRLERRRGEWSGLGHCATLCVCCYGIVDLTLPLTLSFNPFLHQARIDSYLPWPVSSSQTHSFLLLPYLTFLSSYSSFAIYSPFSHQLDLSFIPRHVFLSLPSLTFPSVAP